MAGQANKDKLDVTAVSMADVVGMCGDCAHLCWQRTERVVANASRAPAGFESLYRSVAEERRSDDYAVCAARCAAVAQACPPEAVVRRYEAELDDNGNGGAAATLTAQQAARCEHAVERFTATLFALAHKPSKVAFAYGNIVSAEEPASDGPPTAAHEAVLRGREKASSKDMGNERAMDDEIMRRWSAARRGREEMEQRGLLRSAAEVAEVRRQQQKQRDDAAAAAASGSGHDKSGDGAATRATTPRW